MSLAWSDFDPWNPSGGLREQLRAVDPTTEQGLKQLGADLGVVGAAIGTVLTGGAAAPGLAAATGIAIGVGQQGSAAEAAKAQAAAEAAAAQAAQAQASRLAPGVILLAAGGAAAVALSSVVPLLVAAGVGLVALVKQRQDAAALSSRLLKR